MGVCMRVIGRMVCHMVMASRGTLQATSLTREDGKMMFSKDRLFLNNPTLKVFKYEDKKVSKQDRKRAKK